MKPPRYCGVFTGLVEVGETGGQGHRVVGGEEGQLLQGLSTMDKFVVVHGTGHTGTYTQINMQAQPGEHPQVFKLPWSRSNHCGCI